MCYGLELTLLGLLLVDMELLLTVLVAKFGVAEQAIMSKELECLQCLRKKAIDLY